MPLLPPLPFRSRDSIEEDMSVLLEEWLLLNRWEALADLIKGWLFWALSLIFIAIAIGLLPKIWASAIAVLLVLVCIILDCVLRPGTLYGVHRRATTSIRQIKAELQSRIMATSEGSSERPIIVREISQKIEELAGVIGDAECEEVGLLPFWSWTPEPPLLHEKDLSQSPAGSGGEMVEEVLALFRNIHPGTGDPSFWWRLLIANRCARAKDFTRGTK